MAPAGDAGRPRAGSVGSPARHGPAVPDVLGDLQRGREIAPRRSCVGHWRVEATRAGERDWDTVELPSPDRPVVVAPMAGGTSTPDFVVASCDAGALGFVAAGYKSAPELDLELQAVRARTTRAFGVNLFVPGRPTAHAAALADYARELEPEATRLETELGKPVWEDDDWSAKLELLLDTAPAVVSFTFGCPERRVVAAFRTRGTNVVVTVTDPAEADAAVAAGADALCA